MRRLLAGAAVGLLAPLLVSCGDDDPYASYCGEVTHQQRPLTEALSGGASTGLLTALPSFQALEAKAPRDVRDDWSAITGPITTLKDALTAAGVDPATYDPQHPPSGLTATNRDAIETAAAGLVAPSTSEALAAVQQEVRDVCQTPLTGS